MLVVILKLYVVFADTGLFNLLCVYYGICPFWYFKWLTIELREEISSVDG